MLTWDPSPSPATIFTTPPRLLSAVLSPALKTKSPPSNVVPEPRSISALPPFPLFEVPVFNEAIPDEPALDVPV